MATKSWATTPGIRKIMQANKSRDTAPELAVRRAAHSLGLRYRVSARPIPDWRRTADMVFPRARVAVFVDGCFWHGCPQHYRAARTNAEFWLAKIQGNVLRDQETTEQLEAAGWLVLRFWSHEAPAEAAEAIQEAVLRRQLH